MSYLKNRPQYKLYYSDTDSFVINKPLPSDFVNNQLGYMKLEHTISKAVFLAPKVYGLKLEDGTEIIKVKGLSHKANINFNDLKSLLQKDQSLVLNQVKSLRDITESNINLVNQTYELIPLGLP